MANAPFQVNASDRLLGFIERREKYLKHGGCNIIKMHEYFGLKDTNLVTHDISMTRDNNNPFQYNIKIKRYARDYDLIKNNIRQLPRDVNNYIYGFLVGNTKINITVNMPIEYPFRPAKWTVNEFIKNGKNCANRALFETMKIERKLCDWPISMYIDKQILYYLTMLTTMYK
jgi:hypothetical protein